jgi:hypothetical protein
MALRAGSKKPARYGTKRNLVHSVPAGQKKIAAAGTLSRPARWHRQEQSDNQMTQTPNSRSPASRTPKPRVSAAVERQIDENLKRLYTQSLEEDLPESLRALVERLRQDGAPQ